MNPYAIAAIVTVAWLLILAAIAAALILVGPRIVPVDPVDEAIDEAADLCDPIAAEAERGIADLEALLEVHALLTRPDQIDEREGL